MPVTLQIASVVADEKFRRPTRETMPTAEQVLKVVLWQAKGIECKELLQSSFEPVEDYTVNQNGFVRAVMNAYNAHLHLIIRPDDIWIAVLSQINLYVNAHAEEMRSFFVQHEGQKELEVSAQGNTVDFGEMAQAMTLQLKENINDPLLHDFIMPNFTTTTENDKVICSVMMMSALKSYFGYTMRTRCGIPSLTLLGEKVDYESLVARLDKLATFGREPHTFARLLRPILTQFVNVFDGSPAMDFWSKICHYRSGSGGDHIGGWISTFSVWDSKGKWIGPDIEGINTPLTEEEKNYAIEYESMTPRDEYEDLPVLVLDGLRYPKINTANIADGFCQVDVKLDANGNELKCMMVAGHVGYALLDDVEQDASGVVRRNTLQPSPQWFLFVKGEKAKAPQGDDHHSVSLVGPGLRKRLRGSHGILDRFPYSLFRIKCMRHKSPCMAVQLLTLPNHPMWGTPGETTFPSPQELLSAQTEIKALEIDLRDAVKALEKAQLRIENLKKRLKERRAWIAPIRQLPVELLSEIFVEHSEEEPLGPVKIASVCRRWRSVVLATLHAWCHIWLHNNLSPERCCQYVTTFLERSDPVLLHLRIPIRYELEDEGTFSICSVLFQKPHRIRCLSIITNHLAYFCGRTFPNLTDLSLLHDNNTFLPPSTFKSTFPQLENLAAAEVPWGKCPRLMSSWILPLKHLAILADKADVWLDIIQYCSATLESLRVYCTLRPRSAAPEITLNLPVLKFLEFTDHDYDVNWPTQVRTPALVSYRQSNTSAGRLHGDVTTFTHLQTDMVPVLLNYSSLHILWLKSPLASAIVLFEQLHENASTCPQLEVIEPVVTGLSPEGESYYSAHVEIEEAKRKTARDVQVIFGDRWNIVMDFDIELSRCQDGGPCDFVYAKKRLSIKQ